MQPETTRITKNADLPEEIRQKTSSEDVETIGLELRVEQPGRKKLHAEVVARMQAAKAPGVRLLEDVPRIGAFHMNDRLENTILAEAKTMRCGSGSIRIMKLPGR